MRLIFSILLFLTFITPLTLQGQDVSCCDLKVINDVTKIKIDVSKFTQIDTTINKHKYNLIFQCENGTVVLGNVDKKGVKNGRWSFNRFNSTGYEGHITGNFKNGKMDGYWSHGPYSSLYKKGKCIKTTKIPF